MWIHLAVSTLFLPFLSVPKILDLRKITVASAKSCNSLRKMICNTDTLCLNLTLSYKKLEMTSTVFLSFELKAWNKRCQLKCLRFTNLRRWTENSHYFPRNILLLLFCLNFNSLTLWIPGTAKKKKKQKLYLHVDINCLTNWRAGKSK